MAESRYEKYVVRRPSILHHVGGVEYGPNVYREEIPKTSAIPVKRPQDSGPLVVMAQTRVPQVHSTVEYVVISADISFATKDDNVRPHKHTYDEIFIFMGTDPKNVGDLGAEIEFWLGEGKELDKVDFNTSSSIFLPAGLAHFPAFIRNVRRPFIWVVIEPDSIERNLLPVDLKGRPTYD